MPFSSKCGYAAASSYLVNGTLPLPDATCNDAPVPFTQSPPPSPPRRAASAGNQIQTSAAQDHISALGRYQHLVVE